MNEWMVQNILTFAVRLSPHGRGLQEEELNKMSRETLSALWQTLRDAEASLQAERRTFRPFHGGPSIRF